MSYSPLEDITILDFSHRLPGPLSTLQLTRLGAKVIKVEDKSFGDPFDGGSFDAMDSSFSDWYRTLNENKEIRKLDLKSDKEEIAKLVKSADIVLMGLPSKVQKKFALEIDDFRALRDHGVFMEMTSSREQAFGMHDLNALAKTNLLALHLNENSRQQEWIAPPFLPVAGVTFASHLATEMLAALIHAQKKKTWVARVAALEEAVQFLLAPLYSKALSESAQKEFLHNGRYPCYAIYPLKDKGYLAVASVEQKYWDRFCQAFNLDIEAPLRFSSEASVFSEVARSIRALEFQQAQALSEGLDACVTLID